MKTAFLDSSVLFTAVNSPTGGSAKLFTLKNIELKASKVVLTEVERNIREKLQNHHLERFFMLVDKLEIVQSVPEDHLIKRAKAVIAQKDAVILAEAKESNCNFVVSLDKKHFLTPEVSKFLKPGKVSTPKQLLQMLEG